MNYYTEISSIQREGFEVVIDWRDEEIHPSELFEAELVGAVVDKIDSGNMYWFMLRVRIMIDEHVMARLYRSGCYSSDPRDALTDGVAEEAIEEALVTAKEEVVRLKSRLAQFPV